MSSKAAPIYEAADPRVEGALPVDVNPLTLLAEYVNQGVDPDKLKAMMDLTVIWQKNEAKKKYVAAMNRCQAKMPVVIREKTNSQTNKKYAAVEDIQAMAHPVYVPEGFTLSFTASPGGEPSLSTVHLDVTHVGGHTERHTLPNCPLDDKGPKGGDTKTKIQGLKSSLSYAKGMLICMAFNITVADQDKDGAGSTLNKDQLLHLGGLINNIESLGIPFSMEGYLAYMKVTAMEDILQSDWETAKWGLEAKLKAHATMKK